MPTLLAFPVGQGACGAKTIFHQTCAPTGWVKCTSLYNCYSLRVVTGTPGTGGSQPFNSVFTSGNWAVTSATIASGGVSPVVIGTCAMASHSHSGSAGSFCNQLAHYLVPGSGSGYACQAFTGTSILSGCATASHTHAYTSSTVSYTGNPYNFSVQYIDFIVAIKS
jgi:hypothetical protein